MIPVDLIRVKCALLAPFHELPDVVIACIEHKVSLEAFRAIEVRYEAPNNMKIILGG